MPDKPTDSSSSQVLPYAAPDSRRHIGALTIAAVTCALLPLAIVFSFGGHRSEALVMLTPAFAVGAIVLGKVAHKKSHPDKARDSIAIYASRFGAAELLLVLFAFAVPWLYRGGSTERANRAKCASNMMLIGKAIEQYANANRGQFAPSLDVLLAGRHVEAATLTCPSSNHEMAYGETLAERVQRFRSSPNHCSVVYLGAGMTI